MLRPSIARRLLGWLLLAYAMAWGTMLVIGQVSLRWAGAGEFDQDMVALSEVVDTALGESAVVDPSVLHGVALKLAADGRRMGTTGPYLAIGVYGRAGEPLVNEGLPAYSSSADHGFFTVEADNDRWHVYRRWTDDRSRRIDILQSASTRSQVVDAVLVHPTTVAQVVVGLIVLVVPLVFAIRAGLRPLSRLSAQLLSRGPADLAPIAPAEAHVELVPILDGLNGTLQKLRSVLDREREFLADAAHELRTPLAVIAAQCESLRSDKAEVNDGSALKQLERSVSRATRTVHQLMTLAHLEANADMPSSSASAIDVADCVRDALALFFDEAQAAGVELQYAGPGRLPVECNLYALESVLHNLISNAIRYGAQQDGIVEVRVAASEDQKEVRISVSDNGSGIDLADRARLFQRFRRGPLSAERASGSGLGLSIVQAAAHRLGAELTLDAGLNGRGLMVSLVLARGHGEPRLNG